MSYLNESCAFVFANGLDKRGKCIMPWWVLNYLVENVVGSVATRRLRAHNLTPRRADSYIVYVN